MPEHLSATPPPLWISETDEHGNQVSREVVEAAHRIWSRVLQYVRLEGRDLAPAAEILESACHCVSRVMRRNRQRNHIRNIDSYLYWAFVRGYNRRMVREARIQYVKSVETFADARIQPDHNWVSMLDNEIQFKQLLGYMDPKTRHMLMRRISGDSWAEIGESLGINTHNAEVQFANGIKKARSRLFGQGSDTIRRGKL
jgi:DNA-directed RNA polymerase specialized sigma24 family protein